MYRKQKKIFEEDSEPEVTFLNGLYKEAWDYKLGNCSALEWILKQYKEKKNNEKTCYSLSINLYF